jgi:hypothetical protein
VKIITAAAVTDVEGNLVCGTPSKYGEDSTETVTESWDGIEYTTPHTTTYTDSATIYSNINSNAQAYFGADIAGLTVVSDSVMTTVTDQTSIFTQVVYKTIYTNSAGESVNTDDRQPGITISFATPYVYLPESSMGSTGEPGDQCRGGSGSEGFGYPPQTLLDYMVGNPSISSQFLGLASCLPGGPSFVPASTCSKYAPVWQGMSPALIRSND